MFQEIHLQSGQYTICNNIGREHIYCKGKIKTLKTTNVIKGR